MPDRPGEETDKAPTALDGRAISLFLTKRSWVRIPRPTNLYTSYQIQYESYGPGNARKKAHQKRKVINDQFHRQNLSHAWPPKRTCSSRIQDIARTGDSCAGIPVSMKIKEIKQERNWLSVEPTVSRQLKIYKCSCTAWSTVVYIYWRSTVEYLTRIYSQQVAK